MRWPSLGDQIRDLSLGSLPAELKNRLLGPPDATGIVVKRPPRPSVDQLRVEAEHEEDIVANVVRGRADPLLYEYLRGARRRFEADARQLADEISLGPSETMRSWGRGYLRRDTSRARGDYGPDDLAADLRRDLNKQQVDLAAAYAESLRTETAAAEERRAEICLDVAPGRETSTTLRVGSGSASLDRLALASFEKAVASRPVSADVRPGIACYQIGIRAFRALPMPILSCGFDGGAVGCVWPFKKVTSVSARLISVDYSGNDKTPANHSLLRTPR
jgi:hypothetical protein